MGMPKKQGYISLFVAFALFWAMSVIVPRVLAQESNLPALSTICDYGTDAGCKGCVDGGGAWTAVGCIQTSDPGLFIGSILRLGIGISGGIAFLLILFGGFQILTSAGNPEQLNAGRELISSAVAGLLLIIFSTFIMQLIGYNIFHIPGFDK